jgi:hypothetical protein
MILAVFGITGTKSNDFSFVSITDSECSNQVPVKNRL